MAFAKAILLVPAALVAGIAVAAAHAMLERAEPAVGSVVPAPPAEVRLLFTEPLEPAFSRAAVLDAEGRRVDLGEAHPDPADPTLLRVPLRQPLAPGSYRVDWRVVSVDTHVTSGNFTFRVAP